MTITRSNVAGQLSAYLRRDISEAQLVDWAENAMMDGELDENVTPTLAAVLARLGLGDVRAFGLTWEDCRALLEQLGYAAHVEVQPA